MGMCVCVTTINQRRVFHCFPFFHRLTGVRQKNPISYTWSGANSHTSGDIKFPLSTRDQAAATVVCKVLCAQIANIFFFLQDTRFLCRMSLEECANAEHPDRVPSWWSILEEYIRYINTAENNTKPPSINRVPPPPRGYVTLVRSFLSRSLLRVP